MSKVHCLNHLWHPETEMFGVDPKLVNTVDMSGGAMFEAWDKGEIDGCFIWDPMLDYGYCFSMLFMHGIIRVIRVHLLFLISTSQLSVSVLFCMRRIIMHSCEYPSACTCA